MVHPTLNCPCDRRFDELAFKYDVPPVGETRFDIGTQAYCRAYSRCRLCGHWYSQHNMDLTNLYSGAYVETTYGCRMRQTFDRILALPSEKSDNAGRVVKVLGFASSFFSSETKPTLLDVGSGLGVFPYRMKEAGWICTALDPDPQAAVHLREVVGAQVVTGDFMLIKSNQLGKFDVISFNKVLEHVEDPVAMLVKAFRYLNPGGFVYAEVPDGEAAASEGSGREEFFIEHHHVFSVASLALMASRAGFCALDIERLREPSSKYTIRTFLTPISGSPIE